MRHGRKRWILWAIALIIVITAICLNFSRAGIVILVAASAIWIATVALRLDAPTRAGTACRISLAVSFLLLLVSALLVAGGETVARFHLEKFAGTDISSDFRWSIFRDTWQLIRSSPWVGVGLGNFESIFAIFRDASRGTTRSLHPESDWLWVWSELGWVAVPLILLGAVLLVWRVAPLQVGAKQLAVVASRGHNFGEAINLTNRALDWAPLDWELYYLRATAEIGQREPAQKALDDFRRARFLEPNSESVPLQEGFVWLRVRPELALMAWREALRRAGPERKDIFRTIMFTAKLRDPAARQIIRQLAFSEHDLALVYFAQLNAEEFRPAFSKFFDADPDLVAMKPEEKRELFQLWDSRGDINVLIAAVNKHPDWLQFTWRTVAKYRGSSGDFRGACELMQKFDSNVVFPPEERGQSIEQLRERVYRDTNNFSAAYTLYRQQMNRGLVDDALATIRHFTVTRKPPAYFYLLEAQAWAAKNNWERSWSAWTKFEEAKQK